MKPVSLMERTSTTNPRIRNSRKRCHQGLILIIRFSCPPQQILTFLEQSKEEAGAILSLVAATPVSSPDMPDKRQPRKQPDTVAEPAPHPLSLQAERRILMLRCQRVMLDFDLAELYGIETRALKQAVRRNLAHFPDDFMFELDETEVGTLVSQTVIPGRGKLGGASPMAFTEQGVAMLSSVLRSPRAVQVNIGIMRAFVRLRELLLSHADLARKLDAMEQKYDSQFKIVFDAIRRLMTPPPPPPDPPAKEIGFHVKDRATPYRTRRQTTV